MEFISIPLFYKDKMVISKHKKYMSEIIENNGSMDWLRTKYFDENLNFFDFIEELRLRNFRFILKEKNNILYNLKCDNPQNIIMTSQNENKYKKLNFKLLGLDRFSNYIDSDFYFNCIPLENILHYSKNSINKRNLTLYFQKNGFDIININRLDEYIEDIEKKEISKNVDMKSKNIYIEDVFIGGKFNMVRNYCLENQIDTLDKLKEEDLYKIFNIKGIGEYKKDLILKKIKEVEKIKKIVIEAHSNSLKSRNINIKDIFFEKKFKKVTNNIYSIDNFNLENISGQLRKDVKEQALERYDLFRKLWEIYRCKDKNEEKRLKLLYQLKDTILITDIRIPKKFNPIIKYLNDNNIISIKDYLEFDSELIEVRGVGNKKKEQFNKIIKDEIKNINEIFNILSEKGINKNYQIYELIKDEKVSEILMLLNIKISENQLKKYEVLTLEDLIDKKDKINSELNIIYNIFRVLPKGLDMNSSLKELIKNIKISERDHKILKLRLISDMTLEEIGEQFDITRERVRQIYIKSLKKFTKELENSSFPIIIKISYLKEKSISIENIYNNIDKDYGYMVEIIKLNKIDGLYYDDLFEKIYFKNIGDDIKKINNSLDKLTDTYGYIQDLIDLLNIDKNYVINTMSLSDLEKLMNKRNYVFRGEYYINKNISSNEKLDLIFRDFFKDPIKLDEYGISRINSVHKDIFGTFLNDNQRNLDGMIRRNNSILLCAPRTFIHRDHVKINKENLKNIKIKIDKEIEKYSVARSEKVYLKLDKDLQDVFKNKHLLYSIFKYYYEDEYNFISGNTLNITPLETKRVTNKELIESYIKDKDGSVEISKIKKELYLDDYKINSIIDRSNKLFKVGNRIIFLDDLFLEDEKDIITKIIKENMEKGYSSCGKIYNQMLFNKKLNGFINRNLITLTDIASIAKYLFDEIEGHTRFLYKADSKIKSLTDYVIYKHKDRFYRENLEEIILDLGYSLSSISVYLGLIIDKGNYIQVEENEYVVENKIIIDDVLKHEVIKIANEMNNKKGFILAEKISKKLSGNYNQYIISYILKNNGFKELNRKHIDYRYEQKILIDESIDIDNFDMFVYKLIQKKYYGSLVEEEIYQFLINEGIYEETNYIKNLPYELKNSELFIIDDVHNVKFKELNYEN